MEIDKINKLVKQGRLPIAYYNSEISQNKFIKLNDEPKICKN